VVTYWYCPPDEGYAEASSARPRAGIILTTPEAIGIHVAAAKPPNIKCVDKRLEVAIQELQTAIAKASNDHSVNCLGMRSEYPDASWSAWDSTAREHSPISGFDIVLGADLGKGCSRR
jgi:hypothetical protein